MGTISLLNKQWGYIKINANNNSKMLGSIRQQMSRYPIFSYQPDHYIDESEMFKDEEIKNSKQKHVSSHPTKNDLRSQTIINIYDRIASNNASDPLYLHARKQKQKDKNRSSVTTARNSRCDFERNDKKIPQNKNISRFVGELAQSLNKQQTQAHDSNRTQKISLLKRIIQHYNIKSVERKYYSNLIKNFGIKIQSVNTNDIAVKKSLHPRQTHTRSIITREKTQPIQQTEIQETPELHKTVDRIDNRKSTIKRKALPEKFHALTKQYSFKNSRQNIKESSKQKNCSFVETDIKLRGQISQKMRRSIEFSQKLIQKPIKLNISTSIQDKINKYRQFLFVLNFTNKIYKDLDIEKYQQTFKYFVGKGNNGNLIKSLMKKRFWFQQTNNVNEAHFIWTQLKVQQIFQKQVSGIKHQNAQNIEFALLGDDTEQQQKIQVVISTQQFRNQTKIPDKVANLKQMKFAKIKCKARDYAPHNPFLKIATEEDVRGIKEIGQCLSHKKFLNFSDRQKFSKKKLSIQGTNSIIHNHFSLNGLLGNKKALYYNLKQYCKLFSKKLSDYVPLTYHIKKGLVDPEYKAMAAVFTQRKKLKYPNYWIMKPGQFSNRGQGITCTNKLEQVRQRISKCRQQSKSGKQSSLIVQLYISNPLLYNGRKFDIRAFMMVTMHNGKIKGYWYQQGYVRTSSFVWSLQEIGDKYIHLTNDAIQKTCDEYGRYEPGNKLTFADLQRYIYTLQKSGGKCVQFFDALYPQMRGIAADAIRCACLNLDPARLRDNFQVFGLDFMVDDNYKPWLIEVNTNPCLQLNCPILQRILPHMVENALRIALDPLFPPPSTINSDYKYSIPQNALHYNKFELVFDEDRDGDQLKRLYKNSNIMEQLDDLQQQQQLYEEDGDILDIKQA